MDKEVSSEFFAELGYLHDARVASIIWDLNLNSIQIFINDLYSNFAGFPEYKGKTPVTVNLSGVTSVESHVEPNAGSLQIIDFEVWTDDADVTAFAEIKFNPAGVVRIKCAQITCRIT